MAGDLARHQTQSYALLFDDGSSAYATTMRYMIMPSDRPTSERLAAFLAEHLFAPDDIAGTTNAAANAASRGITEPHLTHLAGQLTAHPWLGVNHSEGIVAPYIGVVAGQPLADMLFGLVSDKMAASIKKEAHHRRSVKLTQLRRATRQCIPTHRRDFG